MNKRLLALLVLAGLILQAATLTAYPPPHCDDTYYTDTAYTALTQGRFGSRTYGPVYDIDQNHTIHGRLYSLGLAGVLAALGVSLTSARLYSVLGWLAAVAGTYYLGRRLYGHQTALWAALLFAVSLKAFTASRLVRPDMWMTAGIVWVLAAFVHPAPSASEKSVGRRQAFALGLAGALLADIHFIGTFFLAGMGLVAVYQWAYLQRRFGLLAALGLGAAVGMALWAALHFLPNPESAWFQWRVGYTRMGMGAGSLSPWVALLDLGPWIRDGFWSGNRGLNALEGLLFAAGLGYAGFRRSRSDVRLVIVLAASLIAFGALFAQKLNTYRVLWTPLLWLLAVEAALAALQRVRAALAGPGAGRGGPAVKLAGALRPAIVLGPLVVLYLAGMGWLTWQFRGGRLGETTAALRALIPPGTTVLGDPTWWFSFQADHRYYGDLYLTYLASEVSPPPGAVPVVQHLTEPQIGEALDRIDAEYVILDERLHCLQDEDYQPFYAFREYVESHCAPVGEVTGGWYGRPWAVTYALGEKSEVYQCA